MQPPTPLARRLALALALAAPLGACDALTGKEVARLPINVASTAEHNVVKEATLTLKKDDKIALWSDMDLAYDGDAPLRFQVRVWKNGTAFKQLELDPTESSVTMNSTKTDFNGRVKWSFSGKNDELLIPENGTYKFEARLLAGPNPSLKIAKAELVLKQ